MGDDGGKDVHEGLGDIVVALRKWYAPMMEVMRSQYEPNAQAELDLAKKFSPEYGKLQIGLMDTVGRELAAKGRELAREEQLGASETEALVAEGPGKRLAAAARALQEGIDPEYFAQRAAQSRALDKAESAIDPNKLTAGETEAISRGLGRTAYSVPSPGEAWKNASAFGSALARRRAEYNNLINTRTAAMPGLRSGLEGFSAATKRSVTPNFGLQNYTGIQTPGLQQSNFGFGQFMQPANTAMSINMQKQASDWDKFNKGVGAVGNTLGVVGQAAGAVAGMGV